MSDSISGSLYIKSGRYYGRIYYYKNGERKQKSFTTGVAANGNTPRKIKQQEKAAQRVLNERLSSFMLGAAQDAMKPSEQLFADTAKAWLERQRGSKAASTLAGYQYIVNDIVLYFTEINPVRTVDLSSSMVEDYLSWERSRRQATYEGPHKRTTKFADGAGIENTVLHRATIVRAILQTAKRDGVVATNVAAKRDCWVDLPKPQQHVFAVLTPEEARDFVKMLKNEPLWLRVAVLLALLLGLRRSEVMGLCEADIDMQTHWLEARRVITQQTVDKKNYLTVKPTTKNNRPKRFSLSDELYACLQALVDENIRNEKLFGSSYEQTWEGFLFRDIDGTLISPNRLTREFTRFVERAGCKKIRFHDLRHSCASILHANGVSLRTVQEILGHSQLTTTIMYTHLYEEEKAQALDYLSDRFLKEDEAG